MGRERRSAVVSTRPPGDRRSPWRCGYFRSYPPPTSVAFSASHRPTSTSCYTGSAPVCAAVSNRPSTLPTPAPSPLARSRGLDVTPCKKPAPPVPHAVRTHGLSRNLERPHQRVGGRRQGFRYDTTRCYRPGDAPRRCWAVRPGGADTRPAAPRRRLPSTPDVRRERRNPARRFGFVRVRERFRRNSYPSGSRWAIASSNSSSSARAPPLNSSTR